MTSYKYQKQHASNYNYKGKRSFSQRLKNFFTIPEEDLKEEPSKEFEKIKLFTLNRGLLFLGILVFMILINILVGFNINFLYLRQILGFLFLILIPGLLIMLCFKIRTVKFWEYLVYTVGLSIAFIMFAGLAVNWTLPALNITDKPLSLWPILICFDIFLVGLWLTAIYRNRDLKPFDITIPKLDTLNRIFFIIPMIFPLLSILGAFLLNNHGPNILTMIMIGGIAVYVLLLTIFRKRMNENVWPWALYFIGLSLLLMYSMRSWVLMGNDIVSEYNFFNLTAKYNLWNIEKFMHGYNVCLSINILPTIINSFVHINQVLFFKLIPHVIFPFILISIYIFFKSLSNRFLSFLAAFFFISQVGYIIDMPSHIRQEIAFIFFSLMILVLFTKNINQNLKKILFIIFGVSMIVSHYSTAYLALALFTLTYIFILIYKTHENQKIKKGKINESQKLEFYLTWALVLILLVFGFLWYSQVTPIGNGLVDFFENTISNLGNMFNEELQIQGQSFSEQFKLKQTQRDYLALINEEIEKAKLSDLSDTYADIDVQDASIRIISQKTIPSKFPYKIYSAFYLVLNIIKRLGYVFIFIGLLLSIILFKKRDKKDLFLISLMSIIFFSFIILITIVPFGSTSYSVLRLYQQGLILFSIFGIIGLSLILNWKKNNLKYLFIWFFLILYFFAFTGFLNQIVGSNLAYSNLNNFGGYYELEHISNTEINSIEWLSNQNINKKFYAGYTYESPIRSFGNLSNIDNKIFPQLLKRDSYVYAGNSEVFYTSSFISSIGNIISYKFPKEFLHDNKNKIYNNGGSEIFK